MLLFFENGLKKYLRDSVVSETLHMAQNILKIFEKTFAFSLLNVIIAEAQIHSNLLFSFHGHFDG